MVGTHLLRGNSGGTGSLPAAPWVRGADMLLLGVGVGCCPPPPPPQPAEATVRSSHCVRLVFQVGPSAQQVMNVLQVESLAPTAQRPAQTNKTAKTGWDGLDVEPPPVPRRATVPTTTVLTVRLLTRLGTRRDRERGRQTERARSTAWSEEEVITFSLFLFGRKPP